VAVDGAVAVLGKVAHQRLALVAGAEHERVAVVGGEVVQHGARADHEVSLRHRVALGVGVGRQKGVDDGPDPDDVVLDAKQLARDALGVAHVLPRG